MFFRHAAIFVSVVLAAGAHAESGFNADLQNRVKVLETEVARLQALPVVKTSDGGLRAETPDGASRIRIGGRLQADTAFYRSDVNPLGSGSEIRSARLRVSGAVSPVWDYKLEADFLPGQGVRLTEAYLAWRGLPRQTVMVGNLFELYGLEEFSSSTDLTFMERSLAIDALAPDYNQGVSWARWGDAYHIAAGVFGDSDNNRQPVKDCDSTTTPKTGCNESWGASARAVLALPNTDGHVVSLGASAYWRDPVSDDWRISARPDSHVTRFRAVDTGAIPGVTGVIATGLEASFTHGPWSWQGEWNRVALSRNAARSKVAFNGWYLLGSYVLTGESRPWDMATATYGRIRPAQKGGAWELALRYDTLNLNDGAVAGGRVRTATLGLNWYATPAIKLMANLIRVDGRKDYNNDGLVETDRPTVAQFRVQLAF